VPLCLKLQLLSARAAAKGVAPEALVVVVRWCGRRVGVTRSALVAQPSPEWADEQFYLAIEVPPPCRPARPPPHDGLLIS